MKKILPLVICLSAIQSYAQLNIVPKPVTIKVSDNRPAFMLSPATVVLLDAGSPTDHEAAYLNTRLKTTFGFTLKTIFNVKDIESGNYIRLSIKKDSSITTDESYRLNITNTAIGIIGNSSKGIFYGLQTLLQLLPAAAKPGTVLSVPQLSITDYPGFAYRGAHLDVSRHFFQVSYVKRYIDYLAMYKFNTFHWHLTDDQGWRIEIKKYPRLTSVGGFRNGTIEGRYPGTGNDSLYYGGFYTQEDIKEVVRYATERHIDVIPEIEMPGHASAAIAAYPQLSCFPDEDTKPVAESYWAGTRKGKQVQQTWGVFEDVFCPSEYSFNFLNDVLDEVMQLFPSKYIHVGGDECPKTAWQRSAFCQQLIKEKKLGDEHGLQSYFIERIEQHINSKGRQLIGWNEILEGGLAPNATVMSWQGESGGIAAARQGHDVIMTPGSYCYLDQSQSSIEDSVTIGGYIPLEKVYAYEPLPASLNASQSKHILGAQVNVWTEYMANSSKVEYMIFPRMIAFSEVVWSAKENRSWKDFEQRLPGILQRLDAAQINHSNAFYSLSAAVLPDNNGGVKWILKSNYKGIRKIRITRQSDTGTVPAFPSSRKVPGKQKMSISEMILRGEGDSVLLPVANSGSITAALFKGDHSSNMKKGYDSKPVSVVRQQFYVNSATGKRSSLRNAAAENYPGAGSFTLIDGIRNTMGMSRSGEFLGFLGKDLEATIDLGKVTFVHEIKLHAFEQTDSWIYRPSEVSFYSGADSLHFKLLETQQVPAGKKNLLYHTNLTEPARFIKVVAKRYGTIPDGYPGAGTPAWLFADEIEVN